MWIRIWVSIYSACKRYRGSTGAALGRLVLLVDQKNLCGSLESVGVGCGCRNLGFLDSVPVECMWSDFLGYLGFFLDSIG